MLLHRLVMRNFKRYCDQEITFCDGITGIVGNNGAGKSSIIEAILFALYGLQGTGLDGSYIVSAFADRQEPCEVRLDFSVAGNEYSVVRRFRKRPSSTLHEARLFLNGRPFGEYADGVQNVLLGVQRVIGMGPADFKNTIYAGQKDLLSLLESRPGSRKDWFMQVLGIEYLKRDSMEELRRLIDGCEKKLSNLTGRLEELDGEAVRDRLLSLQSDYEAAERAIRRAGEERTAAGERRDEVREELGRLLKVREQYLQFGAEESRQAGELERILLECREIEEEIAENEAHREEIARLAETAGRYEEAEAGVAGYAEKKACVERIELECAQWHDLIGQHEARRQRIVSDLESLRQCEERQNSLEQEIARRRVLLDRLDDLKAIEPEYLRLQDDLSRLDERFCVVERRVVEIRGEIEVVEEQQRRLEELEAALEEYGDCCSRDDLLARAAVFARQQMLCRREMDDLAAQVSEIDERIGALSGSRAALDDLEGQVSALTCRKEELLSVVSSCIARKEAICREIEKIARNRDELTLAGREGRCPTCYQHLGDRYEDLLGELAETATSLKASLAAVEESRAGAAAEQLCIQRDLADLDEQRRQHEEILSALALESSRQEDLMSRLLKWQSEYAIHDAAIRELGLLRYDADEHEIVKQRRAALEQQRSRADTLRGICSSLPALRKERKELITEVEGHLARKEVLEAALRSLGFDPVEKKRLEEEREKLEGLHREYTHNQALLSRKPKYCEECEELDARIESLKRAIRDREEERVQLAYDPARHQFLLELYRRAGDARRRVLELEVRMEEIPRLRSRLEKRLAEARQCEAELLRIRQERALLGFDDRQVAAAEEALARAEQELQTCIEEQNRIAIGMQQTERDVERFRQVLSRIGELVRSSQGLREEIELLRLTRKVIGDYIVYLLQVVRDRIEDEAGRILGEITDGRYDTVMLDDDFAVLVHDMGEDYPADRFSGGEQDDIAISLRIALSRFLAEVNEMHDSTFLIFDEIFASQDEGRRSNLVRALRTQESYFPQIFLISHITEVQDEFSSTLMVEMGADRTSRIREIS